MAERWTTTGLTTCDPFSLWRDSLEEAFVRMEPLRISAAPFYGNITRGQGEEIQVSRVSAASHAVRRGRDHIVSMPAEIAFVNLQVAGRGLTVQHGREVRTLPGDIAVADTVFPYEIAHREAFTLYSIAMPRHRVPATLLKAGVLHLSQGEISRLLASAIRSYAELILLEDNTGKAVYETHVLDLLAHATSQVDMIGAAAPATVAFPLLFDCLRQNFHDPGMSAERLARLFGISDRYVHKLFKPSGATFSEHLRELRLVAAAGYLGRPGKASITATALACGFSDLSYFSRCFKSRFGETPEAYRRRLKNERAV